MPPHSFRKTTLVRACARARALVCLFAGKSERVRAVDSEHIDMNCELIRLSPLGFMVAVVVLADRTTVI